MRPAHPSNAGLLALTTALLISLHSGAQEGRVSGAAARRGSGAEAERSAAILPAQFQATVYEVQAAADRFGSLDAKALTSQAATPETLLSSLAQTGKARLLYRIEQPVNVSSTTITIGSSEPVVTGARTNGTGQAINTITYQNVGVIFRLSAQGPPKDQSGAAPVVTAAIRLSVLGAAEKEIAPGQKGSTVRVVSLGQREALELNQPRVVLAISSNAFSSFSRSAGGGGAAETPTTPVAYVIRYEFGPPAQGNGGGAAGTPAAVPESARSTNTLTAQFQATVYEVEATTNRWPALDIQALARVATPELLLVALDDAGTSRVLYRIDQPVNVFSDQVEIRTNKSVLTSTRMSRTGKPLNSYTYQDKGISVRLSAQAPPKDAKREGPDVTIAFTISADSLSNTELGLGQMARGFPMISQEHAEPLEPGRPRLMLAMGSAAAAEQAKPFVYVVRYQFGPPATK